VHISTLSAGKKLRRGNPIAIKRDSDEPKGAAGNCQTLPLDARRGGATPRKGLYFFARKRGRLQGR